MTLMQSGKCRCDARCYMAKGKDCHCICGGKNHGVGLEKAVENTKELGDEMAKEYEAKNPGKEVEIKINE